MIHCLIKHRYSDFQVKEIFNGQIIELTDEQIPCFDEYDNYIKFCSQKNPDPPKLSDVQRLQEICNFSAASIEQLTNFFNNAVQNSQLSLSSAGLSKEARTLFHQVVRNTKDPRLESIFDQEHDTLTVKFRSPIFPKINSPSRYWNFVLAKFNMDTMTATYMLSNSMKLQKIRSNQINYCGIKDQRGVTFQIMQVPGYFYPQCIKDSIKNYKNIRIGAFQPSEEQIKLGSHNGNQFLITIRALKMSHGTQLFELDQCQIEKIYEHLYHLKTYGVINAFGFQRFGCGLYPTDRLGLLLLQLNFSEFIQTVVVNEAFIYLNKQDKLNRLNDQQTRIYHDLKTFNNLKQQIQLLLTNKQEFQNVKLVHHCLQAINNVSDFDNITLHEVISKLNTSLSVQQQSFYFHAFQSRMFNDIVSQFLENGHQVNNLESAQFVINKCIFMIGSNIQQLKEFFNNENTGISNQQTKMDQYNNVLMEEYIKYLEKRYKFNYHKFLDFFNENYHNFRQLIAPGSVRNIYNPVKDLQYVIIGHDDIEQQFTRTIFDQERNNQLSFKFQDLADKQSFVTQYQQQQVIDNGDIVQKHKYVSLLLKFVLDNSTYATQVIAQAIGSQEIVDNQQSVVQMYPELRQCQNE